MPVLLVDSTLREGEQTPGVSFTLEDKIEIARALDEFGIDFVEAGHPAVSPDVERAVREIARLGLRAEVIAHSRALRSDIDLALKADVDWVGIFFSVADRRLEAQFRKNMEEAEKLVSDCVSYAKAHGLKVRYTPEDTVRSDLSKVVRISRAALDAGADRISVADTTGCMDPTRMRSFVERLLAELGPGAVVGVHCHNDLGLAVANSLAGVEGGAQVVDVTVNGLGERAGIASLAETAVALRLLRNEGSSWKLDLLPSLSHLVESRSKVPLPPHAPIVGRNAFTHNAGLHVAAVLLDPRHYESIPCELVGRKRRFVVDKMAGRATVRYRLEELGLDSSDEVVEAVLSCVKRRGINDASDEELRTIHSEVAALREILLRRPREGG